MENNDLKKLWAQLEHEKQADHKLDVDRILRSKSQSVVDKFLRMVKIDGIAVLVIMPLLACVAFLQPPLKWLMMGAELMCVYELVLFYSLFRRMKRIYYSDSLRNYFLGVLAVLQGFFRHYLVFGFIMVVGFYSWAMYTVLGIERLSTPIGTMSFCLGFISGVGAFSLALYLMYGKKIRALKTLIADMEQEEV